MDHFLISSNFQSTEITIRYDGANLSDHNPITIKTNSFAILHKSKSTKENDSLLKWDKADDFNITNYRRLIDLNLDNFSIPASLLNCQNYHCKIHDEIINEKLDCLIQILIACSLVTIPKQKVNGKRGMPGWNQYVKPYKEDSIFWHNMWISAGRPQVGQLTENRKFSKYKYKWAIKQVKRNKDKILSEKTALQIENKSFNEFWSTIKKISGQNKSVANVVDDKYTEKDIADNFCSKYEQLYNSVPDNELNLVGNKVRTLITNNCCKGKCKALPSHNIS